MMSAHYALSDAAIVLVAIWSGVALWRNGQRLPAMAMACFATPAAIGVVRLGGGLQAELGALHTGASQLLGLAGAFMLAVVFIARPASWNDRHVVGAVLVVALAVFFLAKSLFAPFFLAVLVVALGAALLKSARLGSSWLVPSGLAILLVNALLIRRAPWLSDATAWHAYHLLIALALGVLAKGMIAQLRS